MKNMTHQTGIDFQEADVSSFRFEFNSSFEGQELKGLKHHSASYTISCQGMEVPQVRHRNQTKQNHSFS